MKTITLILLVTLTGCASTTYYKPGVDQATFQKDAYECQQQGQAASMGNMFIGQDMTAKCMRVRGYTNG